MNHDVCGCKREAVGRMIATQCGHKCSQTRKNWSEKVVKDQIISHINL